MTRATDLGRWALDYHGAGWHPIPLPEGAKHPPPTDLTGYSGRNLSRAEVEAMPWPGNVGLRMPSDVFGLDVDVYSDGAEGLTSLVSRFGPLPDAPMVTSRDDGSGIRFFRVPNGSTFASDPVQGIQSIQWSHRYTVAAPSVHPSGRVYRWEMSESGEPVEGVPSVEDLPDLPWRWIEGLAAVKGRKGAGAADQETVRRFLDEHVESTNPSGLNGIRTMLRKARAEGKGRHDTLVTVACMGMRHAAAGKFSATDALDVLHAWWESVRDPDKRPLSEGEFAGAIAFAIAEAEAEPERIEEIRNAPDVSVGGTRKVSRASRTRPSVNGDAEPEPEGERHLTDDFWNETDVLFRIRDSAWSHRLPADAVLGSTLATAIAYGSPRVVLPPLIGQAVACNLYVALLGPPGAGKSQSMRLAKSVLAEWSEVFGSIDGDLRAKTAGPGSGEGVRQCFFQNRPTGEKGEKAWVRSLDGLLLQVDEVATLQALFGRSSDTFGPIMRTAWNGLMVDFSYAKQETNLPQLKELSYRLAAIACVQPSLSGTIVKDDGSGWSQRWLWLSASDPAMPDIEEIIPWPGAIEVDRKATEGERRAAARRSRLVRGGEGDVPLVIEVPTSVRRQVQEEHHAIVKEEIESGHNNLLRLKVAAALILLEGRLTISEDDWRRAGAICDVSEANRQHALRHLAQEAEAKDRVYQRRAAGIKVAEKRAVASEREDEALAYVRRVLSGGPRLVREIRSNAPKKLRVEINDAIETLTISGAVIRYIETSEKGQTQKMVRLA